MTADASANVESIDIFRKVLVTLLLAFVLSKVVTYRKGLKAVDHLPGYRVLFHPFTPIGAFIPTTWWNPGFAFFWNWRRNTYTYRDTISLVPYLFGPPTIYTSNLDVANQVAVSNTGRKAFPKPPDTYRVMNQWGANLITVEGETWRKHRRVVGPAFNNDLYQKVWAETVKTYGEMIIEEGWNGKTCIEVPVLQTLTFKLALLIIGKCGFGFPLTWAEPLETSDGKMTLQEAFHYVSGSGIIDLFLPSWFQHILPFKKVKRGIQAKKILMGFMREQVAIKKADVCIEGPGKSSDTSAFSMLVQASENEEDRYKLGDSEVIGNVFVMLFAGHETTAHTIAATLALLAVHEDIQEETYQNIVSVVGHGEPVYDDYPKLNKVLGAFFEALRLFPSGFLMVRQACEDTILNVPKARAEEGSDALVISKGTHVAIDMVGVHYNPRYYESPEEYRPSRWYEIENESEMFPAFSMGPRTCVGRKFATTEAVAFITMILKDYKIEPLLSETETRDQWRKRVLDASLGLALGVKTVPLVFTRRLPNKSS